MMKRICKIIFFGTPEFAVPTLKALLSAPFCKVVKVVTQPDKPVGRHHSKLVPCAVKKAAEEAGISVFTPPPPNPLLITRGGMSSADLGVLVAYGEIIPKEIIDSFPLGILNLHPSLLPKYRGSSPIQAAILNQDKETGVTIMKLDDKMDHGPIVAQEKIEIPPPVIRRGLGGGLTAGELSDTLARIGADLLTKILPDYIAGKIMPKAQDDSKATFTKKLTKQDGKIDWNSMAKPAEPLVRAMNPWPGAWTMWKNKKLIIWKTSIDRHSGGSVSATNRIYSNKDVDSIASGVPSLQNDIIIQEVQLEGKKKMPYSEFLKGHPDFKTSDCK